MLLNDYGFVNFVQNGKIKIGNNIKTNMTSNKYQQDMFERISKELLEYNTGLSYEVNDFDFDHLITCNYYDTGIC